VERGGRSVVNKFQPGNYRIMQLSDDTFKLTHIKGKAEFILTWSDDGTNINF
jgi:hypothetical protein